MKGLDELYTFKMLVDCGGISAASRKMSLPKSTLARRLEALEKRLGVPLILRGSNRFMLTNFGRECYAQCSRVVRETDKVFDMANRAAQTPSGFLHVVCPPMLGSYIIEKLAAEFVARAPRVKLHLEETAWLLDPRSVSADLLIYATTGPLPDLDVVARRIFTSPYKLVADPSNFVERAAPQHPRDLSGFDCIGFGPKSGNWSWSLRKGKETAVVDFSPRFSTNQLSAVITAVRQGIGIAGLPAGICDEETRQGRLVPVLGEWSPQPANIYAVYPHRRTLTMAAEHFLELVEERLPELLAEK